MADRRKLVALALPAGPAFLQAWDEIWARGDALLPLRPELPEAERARLQAQLQPDEWWDQAGCHPSSEAHSLPLDARTDLVAVTSGSTGGPKGVELSRTALEASAGATLQRLGAGAKDPWLCALPLTHLAGLQVVMRARLAGAPLQLLERFEVAAVAASDAAFVSLVPTMLRRALEHGADLSHFKAVLLGGAAAEPELLARARAAGVTVVTTYGMTETAGGCVYDGVPLDGVDVRIGVGGHVQLRGPMLFHGYRNDPAQTAKALHNGWLTTADLGELRDGRLHILGRSDDVIITGGENVSSAEVVAALSTHPAVAAAAVCGVPDPEWGQAVAAAVVARPGLAPPSLTELRQHVASRAPAYCAPRIVLVVDHLPVTALGKIDRSSLRRLFED